MVEGVIGPRIAGRPRCGGGDRVGNILGLGFVPPLVEIGAAVDEFRCLALGGDAFIERLALRF